MKILLITIHQNDLKLLKEKKMMKTYKKKEKNCH